MKFTGCLLLSFALVSCVRSQRISSWGSYSNSYGTDSGSSWNSNKEKNSFGSNQNSRDESLDSNDLPGSKDSYSTGNSFSGGGSNRKPSSWSNTNSESWNSGSNRQPNRETFSNLGNSANSNSEYDNEKNSGLSSWSSNKPRTTSKPPRKQRPSSGSSGNWESNAFSTNNRPNDKKTGSITNSPSSENWNANGFSSNDNKKSSNTYKEKKPSPVSSYDQNSNSVSWGLGDFESNDEPTSNEISSSSDYGDNSVWNFNNNNGNSKTTPKPKKNGDWYDQNSETPKKKKPSDKKPLYAGTGESNSNGNFNEGQNEKNEEKGKKSSAPDFSFLDDLDKNDWYFGSDPNPPFKSKLNIDVSELWKTDRNQKNKEGNKRRNYRKAEKSVGSVKCECVSVFLCDEEDAILTETDLGNDPRSIDEFQCRRFTDVCCTNPKLGRLNLGNIVQGVTGEEPLRCGQRKINGNSRGNSAEPGEFPWNLKLESSAIEMKCSASLIHPGMALTAAHCVESSRPEELKVLAGLWSTNGESFQSRGVAKIITHPGYSSKNPRNDIALLVFKNPFKLTDNVNTICLPVTNDKWDPNRCFVAGWTSNGEVLNGMRKGLVGFLPQYECQNIMLVTDFWRDYVLHESFVCGVEKTGREPCLGDEGSPVVCPSVKHAGTYLQIGLVSHSLNCDEYGRPGILTNVLEFLDWINGNTFDLGLSDDIDVMIIILPYAFSVYGEKAELGQDQPV